MIRFRSTICMIFAFALQLGAFGSSSFVTTVLGSELVGRPSGMSAPEGLEDALSELIQDVVPRTYEKKENWDHKKRITTGLKTEGGKFNLKIHRRKREVNHGTWKWYRVEMIEPSKNLEVRIGELRSLDAGRIAFTCYFTSKLQGKARLRSYNRGVHLISLSAEGDTTLRIWLECEISLAFSTANAATGLAIQPMVVNTRMQLDDFRLQRVSKVHGPLVEELGKGLERLINHELDGPKLTAKLNRAIEKKQDRLRIDPTKLFTLTKSKTRVP